MQECRERYGETFSVRFMGSDAPLVLVSGPDAIKALYSNSENELPPGRKFVLEPIIGSRSVMLLEGSEHMARRKLILPLFHGEQMLAHRPTVEAIIGAEIDSWPVDEEFSIHPRMQAVTLETILRVVFGVSDETRHAWLRDRLGSVLVSPDSPGMQLLMGARRFRQGGGGSLERTLADANEKLREEIEARRLDSRLGERSDILSLLMQARFEDGGRMDDADLCNQLTTLLLAGHETTATALAWTFDLLLGNPVKLERLLSSLNKEGEDYLRATIAESLRLRPVVPIAGRRLATELKVDGYTLPAGTDVAASIWLTHTRQDLYPAPLEFRPERFLESPPDTYAWIPFGGGVRRCLGASFAEFEMRIILREVLTRCDLRAARSTGEEIGKRNITLSPRAGTPVVVRGRRPAGHRPAAA